MSRDADLTLASLPSDIIREIIIMEQKSINSARLISYRWNLLSIEHLNNRPNLPSLKSLTWIRSIYTNNLNVLVPNGYENYFFWKRGCLYPGYTKDRTVDDFIKIIVHDFRIPNFGRLFSRCSRIDKLELDMNIVQYSKEFDAIFNAVADLNVAELILLKVAEFTPKMQRLILAKLRAHSVQRLVIAFFPSGLFINSVRSHGGFFSEAVQLVKSISIVDIGWPEFANFLTLELNETKFVAARCESKIIANRTTMKDIHITVRQS